MSIPKICGIETEYGLMVSDPHRLGQDEAASALVHFCPAQIKVPWNEGGETPERDARDDSPDLVRAVPPRSETPESGYMLGNGARLYVDHGHPEYSTPECTDALSLVASDKAGEIIMEQCRGEASRFLAVGGLSLKLFKNNSDHQGHSYGCHENYLVSAPMYRALFRERRNALFGCLIPFLVSRQVVCGAGKVGSENGSPPVAFQISQRADYFETELGLQTMSHRPIVNTRDEPHADPSRFRRLHVITGDANMSEVSTYLKVGTMQILLSMLEDGAQIEDLTLDDPIEAMTRISHDPECSRTVRLANGRRLTAVEIQMSFAEAAQRYVDRTPEASGYDGVLLRWIEVLHKLAEDPRELDSTLDWVIKWTFLSGWAQRRGLDWSSAQLKELDIRYHDIDPEEGIFYLLQSSGKIERIVTDDDIHEAIDMPLAGTRALLRAEHLRSRDVRECSANWSMLVDHQSGDTRQVIWDILDHT